MDAPRLLAVNDVHLTAPYGTRDALCRFYGELLGFRRVEAGHEDALQVTFVGIPRSGPRLIIDLLEVSAAKPMRRQALVQFGTLAPLAEALTERGIVFEWSTGWFFFDRRIGLLDPAGNWIELTSSQPF